MGRKKSLERQIAGKPLAEVKKKIRDFEKQLMDDAIRQVGTLVLEAYLSNQEDPFFVKHRELKKALEDLAEVKPHPQKSNRTPAVSDPQKPSQHRSSSNYQSAGFVPDVADEDL